jgi:hypothetical protein
MPEPKTITDDERRSALADEQLARFASAISLAIHHECYPRSEGTIAVHLQELRKECYADVDAQKEPRLKAALDELSAQHQALTMLREELQSARVQLLRLASELHEREGP